MNRSIMDVIVPIAQDKVTVRSLVEIAMEKNGEILDLDDFQCSDYTHEVYDMEVTPMSNDDEMPEFCVWSPRYVYFPCQNDMGVKWVASIRNSPDMDGGILIRV